MNVEVTNDFGLNVQEFAKARKAMVLGRITNDQWERASADQKKILHQIDLAIQSVTMDDLSELDESDQ